jgi:hypothetical protein
MCGVPPLARPGEWPHRIAPPTSPLSPASLAGRAAPPGAQAGRMPYTAERATVISVPAGGCYRLPYTAHCPTVRQRGRPRA